MRAYDYLFERQSSWARRHGIAIDEAGYMEELNDNLFLPPTNHLLKELPKEKGGSPHKHLFAAHSSTALVVNVFAYWRLYNNVGPIVSALCPDLPDHDAPGLAFEAPASIVWPVDSPGVKRTPPHLDVLIRYRSRGAPDVVKAIGVESKYREPYNGHRDEFAPCYLAAENAAIWKGLEPLRQLAGRIQNGEVSFKHLHAAQLVKHALGLSSEFQGPSNFDLVYLWHPAAGVEAAEHEDEIRRFQRSTDACQPGIRFRAIAYTDLIHSLERNLGNAHGAYVDYLVERYF